MIPADAFGEPWHGRRVGVVGLGRSGAAAATLLCRAGAVVRVTEARDTAALQDAARQLRAVGAEAVELGGHTTRLLEGIELLVVSPGVSESTLPLQWAARRNLPVISEIELAFRFCRATVVAVTGTNGKSTAVTLLAHILRASGRSALACGNLGLPFASVVDGLGPQTIAVVEVSSFQLLGCERFRPKIGVLLNIGANHLDRHEDPQAYRAAKARLFARQTPEDWAVLNGADPQVAALAQDVHARRVWFGVPGGDRPGFALAPQTARAFAPGAQAVLQVARILGLADPLTWQLMRSFRGLEHRLEPVATIRGVHFVNDSKSTTPDSLLFALRQIRGEVVVILGGRDKGLDFNPLATPLHEERVKGVVLIGESRARLRPVLNGSPAVRECGTLEDAVRTAAALAGPGASVLLSPACASFDMFRDFEDRGRAFKAIVKALG